MARSSENRFETLLAVWAAWLMSRITTFWPSFLAGIRTSCYLWPGRQNVPRHGGGRTPRGLLRRPPALLPNLHMPSSPLPPLPVRALAGDRLCRTDQVAAGSDITHAWLHLELLGSGPRHLSPAGSNHMRTNGLRSRSLTLPERPAARTISRDGGTSAATGAVASSSWRSPHYRACNTVRTVRYKIYGYDPRDLAHGWRERLGCMAAADGMCLAGSYVRQGCVELTLDFLVAPAAAAATAAAAVPAGRNGAGPQLTKVALVEAPPLRSAPGGEAGGGGGGGRGLAAAPLGLPSVQNIMGALGLDGGTPAGGAAGGHITTGRTTAEEMQVQVQVLGMEPAAPDAPRVAQMCPRVLLVQPAAPTTGCDQQREGRSCRPCRQPSTEEWGSDDELAATCSGTGANQVAASASAAGTVLLRGTICGPMGRNAHSGSLEAPSVFARGHGEILAACVVRFQLLSSSEPQIGSSTQESGGARTTACMCGSCCCLRTGSCSCERYELEVELNLPSRAGVVLMELSWHGQPGQVVPLLALPAAEVKVASELLGLAAAAAEPLPAEPPAALAAAEPTAPDAAGALTAALARRRLQVLDGMLLDLGVWVQARAPDSGAGMGLHSLQREALGANLLRFAARSGLTAMEAWLARDLDDLRRERLAPVKGDVAATVTAASKICGAAAPSCGAHVARCEGASEPAVATAAARVTMGPPAAPQVGQCAGHHANAEHAAAAAASENGERQQKRAAKGCSAGPRRRPCAQTGGRDSGCGGGYQAPSAQPYGGPGRTGRSASRAAAAVGTCVGGWRVWLHALLVVVGWRVADPGEEPIFQEYVEPWMVNQEHVMQAMEVTALLALLFRNRADPLSPVNLTTLFGALPGVCTSLAYLLLPRPAWARIATAVKVPRYLTYMAAKGVAVYLNRPLPPGVSSFQLGSAMVLHEGLLLPLACLLPPRVAALMTVMKMVPCAGMMLMSGVAASRREAGLRCAAVALVALPTTLLCHAYLRVCFARRWRRRHQQGQTGACLGADGGAAAGKLSATD